MDLGEDAWPTLRSTSQSVRGHVPQTLAGALTATEEWDASADQMLFRVAGVGRFLVAGGRRIQVDPDLGVLPDEIAGVLHGVVLVALLWQRGHLVLHGASVEISGRGVLFVGPPGCGKSSLAAALVARGHRVLTDDVCALTVRQEGVPSVVPGTPFVRLWDDALDALGVPTAGLRRIETRFADPAGRAKYFYPGSLPGSETPLVRIYHLAPGSGAPAISPVAGALRMSTLMNATYRADVADALGVRDARFRQCASVARTVGFARLRRPDDLSGLSELARMVEEDVRKETTP